MALPPKHGDTNIGHSRISFLQVFDHLHDRLAGVDHIIDQQELTGNLTARLRDKGCDIQITLNATGFFAIRARCHHSQRHVVDTREKVTNTHTAASKAQKRIELITVIVDLEDQSFDKIVVLFVINA